jgi:hypothetical protein
MELRSLFLDEPFQNCGIGAEAVRFGYVKTGETAPLSASGFRLRL